MTENIDLIVLVEEYQQALPAKIRRYLNQRGVCDALIDLHLLGWNGRRITIPIFNREGKIAFFKLAKDPEDRTEGPKMLTTPGAHTELYGWDQLLLRPPLIVICEGEFDRMVLEANGFYAVTSTGGAGTFRPEWAKDFEPIKEVYVCFDRDEAGKRGAIRVGRLISHSKLVELPEEVGVGGDVTDFFVRLGHNREDFLMLLKSAKPAPTLPEQTSSTPPPKIHSPDSPLAQRVGRIKADVPIAEIVGQYVKLRKSGNNLVGLCPFHDDHQPSLVVYPSSGTFHCFACSEHGDVIDFLMAVEQLSFSQAIEALDGFNNYHGSKPQ